MTSMRQREMNTENNRNGGQKQMKANDDMNKSDIVGMPAVSMILKGI